MSGLVPVENPPDTPGVSYSPPGRHLLILPARLFIAERYDAGSWYLMATTQAGADYEVCYCPDGREQAEQLLDDAEALLRRALGEEGSS